MDDAAELAKAEEHIKMAQLHLRNVHNTTKDVRLFGRVGEALFKLSLARIKVAA